MKTNIENIIDEALKTEPSFQLRKDFKDRVINAIKKREHASQTKLYLWMALGTLIIIGLGLGTIAYFLPSTFDLIGKANDGISSLVPFAILIGILVTIVQYLDKRFVKSKILMNQF